MKSILLTILVIGFSCSLSAQVQKSTQFISGGFAPYMTGVLRSDPAFSCPDPDYSFSFQRALSGRFMIGVSLQEGDRSESSATLGAYRLRTNAAGLTGRYYFDFSKDYDYPHFFLQTGYTVGQLRTPFSKPTYHATGLLFGQTLRNRREMLTFREAVARPHNYGRMFRNYFRRFGFEYAIGADCVFSQGRTAVLPRVQLSFLLFLDSKSWTKHPGRLD